MTATRWILGFDGGCNSCTHLAQAIERETGGRVAAQSLRDPKMRAILGRERPSWSWEPTLVELADGHTRTFTGLAMRVRLLTGLGPLQTWRVAQLVRRAGVPLITGNGFSSGRRNFLKGAALLGAALLLPGSRVAARQEQQFMYRVTREGRIEGAGASPGQVQAFLATAKRSEHYRNFMASMGPGFAMDTQATVWSMGDQVSVVIPVLYQGQRSDSSFAAILDRQSEAVKAGVAQTFQPAAAGQRIRLWHDSQQIAEVTCDSNGTVTSGWVRQGGERGRQREASGQDFAALGRAAYDDHLRAFRRNFADNSSAGLGGIVALDVSPTDLFNCVNTCLASQGVSQFVIIAIGIACAVACIGTAGLGCVICLGAFAGSAGGLVGFCIGTCQRCEGNPNGC